MASARISLEMPPNIDPSRATLAYGRLALPRLNRELKDDVLLIRQRAVKALCDYLHDHEHIAAAVHEGIIPSLKHLLRDKDVPAFIDEDVLDVLKLLFSSYEPDIVRLNAHKAVELLSINPAHCQAIVDADLIPLLIACVEREYAEIKAVILETLNRCLDLNSDAGLNAGGMQVFTKLLSHHSPEVRGKSAQVILMLTVNPRGRQQAIDKETIPALVGLLSDNDPDVKASAAGALAFTSVTTHGRYTAINADAIPNLLRLLVHSCSRVRVNGLKAITCIAEAPEGRRILLDHVDNIKKLTEDEDAGVRKHANIAVDVITWKP
ncbi:Radial spoke head 14 [Sparganum proliferum]